MNLRYVSPANFSLEIQEALQASSGSIMLEHSTTEQQKLALSCSFRCDQIHTQPSCEFGLTVSYFLSLTWVFNQPILAQW